MWDRKKAKITDDEVGKIPLQAMMFPLSARKIIAPMFFEETNSYRCVNQTTHHYTGN
jgi:hypothetical protein